MLLLLFKKITSFFYNLKKIRRLVSRALYWLKNHNRYYSNIIIDEEVLRSLPDNGPLDDQIPRLEDEGDDIFDDSEDLDDSLVSVKHTCFGNTSFQRNSAVFY
jgi:hypothetical protein